MMIGLARPLTSQAQTAQPAETQSDSITLTAMPPRMGDDNSLSAAPGEKLQTTIKVEIILIKLSLLILLLMTSSLVKTVKLLLPLQKMLTTAGV